MNIEKYETLLNNLQTEKPEHQIQILRHLMRTDLYFLLWYGCARKDIAHPWLYERCKEVQESPDGHLDLWARAHYKSTIITYAKTLQDILRSHGDDPIGETELTFGIFSHIRPLAKGFLRQIKQELEGNNLLRNLFPDIIWQDPKKEAPKWSEDDGLILKRKSNPKEATVEAWGVVDGQPTGKHFDVLVYDDVIERRSTGSIDMLNKARDAWELSLNLGSRRARYRYIGTRYHYNDTYKTIMERQAAKPRIYPATENGEIKGKPVFLSEEELNDKFLHMGQYTYSCQMLQNPVPDSEQTFKREWINFYEPHPRMRLNKYILIDPANEKKKRSDFTAIMVIGLGIDGNYYLLDAHRDKLSLSERAELIFELHRRWQPLRVGYERYGMQADISYIKEKMRNETYHFDIRELGGNLSKFDRIKQLQPVFEQRKFYFPDSIWRTNYEKKTVNLIDTFINEEYLSFPVCIHDDMLDVMARILDDDMQVIWPKLSSKPKDRYTRGRISQNSGWAS